MAGALRDVLRRFLVSVCCAAGGLGGLWLGMLAAPLSPQGDSMLASLADVLGTVAWRVALGAVAGALVAGVLCAYTPGLRQRAD